MSYCCRRIPVPVMVLAFLLLFSGCGSLSRGNTVELEPVTASVETQAEEEAPSSGQTPAPEKESEPETLSVWVVHICGAVNRPGVYTFPEGSRVCDAVALYSDFFADFDKAKANAMLADLKLEPLQRIGAMSKGTQEKMQLCLTMSRQARLYLLDEPLGGVDPAAREYIMNTILRNYSEDAAVVISTHLIDDIEKVLDEVLVLKEGRLLLQSGVDELREERGQSLDEFFRDTFRC